MSASSIEKLASTLQNRSGAEALDARFRALFALKGLASSKGEGGGADDVTERVIDVIDKAFDENDSALLKHELAYVLGQIQDERAIGCLRRILSDEQEHPMVRHEAAEAMGAISSPRALPILEMYLNDGNVSVRETCELALEKIKFDNGIQQDNSIATSSRGEKGKEESEIAALARAKASVGQLASVTNGEDGEASGDEEENVQSSFLPIDPAPAHSLNSSILLASIPKYEDQLTAGDRLPLFQRYRAMFSLRNAVHAARQKAQRPGLSSDERRQYNDRAKAAIYALAAGLSDKSALFRHEICFVFGELAHPSSVESMVRVLSDDQEEDMVRHEAAEALGAVAEEADEADQKHEDGEAKAALSKMELVMQTLRRWAEDEQAPRVVRESCIVALDEMAYNNDPTQFHPVPS